MEPTGIIFAGLDCDADALEAWNRWYDLEHVPPNVAMPGVMLGRRYVAPPALHALRRAPADSVFAAGRGTFLTIYTLCAKPADVFASMTTLRDKLYAENRMNFPPEKKAVREGDVFERTAACSARAIALPPEEVPFVGHDGILIVQRRGAEAVRAWYREEWMRRAVEVAGVHGVLSLTSLLREGLDLDIVFCEGELASVTHRIRESIAHHAEAQILLDAPFERIQPLHYPWVETIRASDLPRSVGS